MTRWQNFAINLVATLVGYLLSFAGWIGGTLAETIAEAEDKAGPAFNKLARVAIKDMFGVDAGSSLTAARGSGGNVAAADAIGDALLKAFSGQARGGSSGGELGPSDAPAKAFLSAMAQMALEGWLEGWIIEALSLGQIETFGDLDDIMSHVLGLGRASAAVHGPLVRHLIVTPLEWKVLKEHRPTLLGVSEIIDAFLRGDYTQAEANEELARLGYSDRRQAMLLKNRLKQISLDDSMLLVRAGVYDRQGAIDKLRMQGFDDIEATNALLAYETQRMHAIEDNALPALTRAFVNRDISAGEFRTLFPPNVYTDLEQETYITLAQLQRDITVSHMTQSEMVDCIELGILPMAAYREWLTRNNYPEEESIALELRLRKRIDTKVLIEAERKRIADERAAEKKDREDAAEARRLEVEHQRALARRGPVSELARAAVRGLVPIARVVEVLSEQYDPDTVQVFVDDIEDQRVAYLAQLQAAEEAKKRAGIRRIDAGAVERAVVEGVLTLDQYRTQLGAMGFPAGDVAILAATLGARLDALAEAKQKRAEAEAAARIRRIDLARFEGLVRRGVRTFADYDALLSSLGFDDASRAGMRELLQLQIDEDAAARQAREDAKNNRPDKGLSLEQFRRGVIIGTRTLDQFDSFLTSERYSADAHAVLVAELQHDVEDAERARKRREQPQPGVDPRTVPLATVARAAALGLVSTDVYQARLVDAGYSDDDIAIEMALLVQQIADAKDAKRRQDEADQAKRDREDAAEAARAAREAAAGLPPPPPTLTLAQLAAAVRAGVQPLEAYHTALTLQGLAAEDIATLVRVLGDELAATNAARARRDAIGSEVKPAGVSLGVLEQQVRDGDRTVVDYQAALAGAGVDDVDVELLVGLLVDELERAGRAQ